MHFFWIYVYGYEVIICYRSLDRRVQHQHNHHVNVSFLFWISSRMVYALCPLPSPMAGKFVTVRLGAGWYSTYIFSGLIIGTHCYEEYSSGALLFGVTVTLGSCFSHIFNIAIQRFLITERYGERDSSTPSRCIILLCRINGLSLEGR